MDSPPAPCILLVVHTRVVSHFALAAPAALTALVFLDDSGPFHTSVALLGGVQVLNLCITHIVLSLAIRWLNSLGYNKDLRQWAA